MLIESLESRRLFSADAQLVGTVLVVTGGDDNDELFVIESNPGSGPQFDVFVGTNFTPLATVPSSLVSRVELFGFGGDDLLVLGTIGSVGGDVWGGSGNDEIHLEDDGTALSTGHGGSGNDLLAIFAGHGTAAFGDSGDDTLISYEQNNFTFLFGGTGNDILQGTDKTFMFGGPGCDTITVT